MMRVRERHQASTCGLELVVGDSSVSECGSLSIREPTALLQANRGMLRSSQTLPGDIECLPT